MMNQKKFSKDTIINDIKKSGLFDINWYNAQSKLNTSSVDHAIQHYVEIGVEKNFNPMKEFNIKGYLDGYKDVAKSGMNPFHHYVKSGRGEGRSPSGQEKESKLSGVIRRFPRFGFGEYGKVDHQISYDHIYPYDKSTSPKLCVHLHLFHQEMAEEFCGYLKNIDIKFDLLVSICQPDYLNLEKLFSDNIVNLEKCIVRKFENRGRDVAPWVVGFSNEIQKYELFLHLHSKKSDYKASYSGWRKFLIHNTIGSINIIDSVLKKFIENPEVGIVYPPYFSALPNQPKWGANKTTADNLMQLMGKSKFDEVCPDFPSGSFFWAKVDAIKPLFDMRLSWSDFDVEDGQLDGTLGHAIERILCAVVEDSGFKSICASVDVSYNLTNYWDKNRLSALPPEIKEIFPAVHYERRASLKGKKIAVFTCITGGFDEFNPSPCTDEGVDYFLYSDSDSVSELGGKLNYQIRQCKYYDPQVRRMARYVKMHPHFFFPDYDYVVWMDANVISTKGIQEIVEQTMVNDWDLGLIAHPLRESYAREAEECIRINADNPELISEQTAFYKGLGVREKNLIETNVIVSKVKSKATKDFFNIWWREICRYSLRDQISVNFALMESEAKFGFILEEGVSVRDSNKFALLAHGASINKR